MGFFCCVAAVVKDSGLALECCCMLCKGCDGCCVFVCIVRHGAVGAREWEVRLFRHADVCLCLVCTMWQFSMLRSALLAFCICWSKIIIIVLIHFTIPK